MGHCSDQIVAVDASLDGRQESGGTHCFAATHCALVNQSAAVMMVKSACPSAQKPGRCPGLPLGETLRFPFLSVSLFCKRWRQQRRSSSVQRSKFKSGIRRWRTWRFAACHGEASTCCISGRRQRSARGFLAVPGSDDYFSRGVTATAAAAASPAAQ